ncbi:hypothetical protein B6U81_04430 [Thermoplasmatales archaeon ex4484_30]|nr:MAG: hypothetical protein B6U81_04430 [Thermoplasmatales archaeon ex4484_30]
MGNGMKEIDELKEDKKSGAQEIVEKAGKIILQYFEEGDGDEVERICLDLIKAHPSMAPLWNLTNIALCYDASEVKKFLKDNEKKIIALGKEVLKDASIFITHSRSSTVVKLLQEIGKEREIEVTCTESRPMCEGKLLAEEIACPSIKVTLVIDSAIFSFIDKADAIVVGADAITLKGIVNKIGTHAIAFLARKNSVPFYVVSQTQKIFPWVKIEESLEKHGRMEIKNIYFDVTPLSLVTAIITNEGLLKENDVKKRCKCMKISPLIKKLWEEI